MSNETKSKKQPKPEKPGNDVLNGVERWIPDGTERPAQFAYEDSSRIWYRSKHEAAACAARAGHAEPEWVPVLKGDDSESEVSGKPAA